MKNSLFVFLLFVLFIRCSQVTDNGNSDYTGDYNATKLYIVDTVENIDMDMIKNGAQFTINLKENGVFSSRLFLPESLAIISVEDTSELDMDKTLTINVDGSYKVDGDKIQFEHQEDYFLENLDWRLQEDRLFCYDTLGGEQVVNGVHITTPITIYDIELVKYPSY